MRYAHDDGPPLFTYAAMAVFIALFAAQFKGFDLTQFSAFPWRIAEGEVWRLVTCTFMHAGIIHILFNTVLFVRFSTVIDNWMGPWVAMAMYAAIAVSSSAAQLLVERQIISLVGASGVVYGLFGFLWVMSRRRDDAADAANLYIRQTLLAWLVICAVINLFGGRIANTAHVWGLLLGWMTGQCFITRRNRRPWMIVATTLLCLLPVALTQKPVWDRTLAHVPFVRTFYPHEVSPQLREVFERPPEPGRMRILP